MIPPEIPPEIPDEAREAAAFWAADQGSLRLIGDRENMVLEARLPAGRAALRLHRQGYQTEAAIRSELWWCGALADAGVPVPRPMPARGGGLLAPLASGRLASAVAWRGGASLGKAGVPLAGSRAEQTALHHRLGALVAGLHAATDALMLPEGFERPRWDIDGLVGDTPFWGRFWEHPALTADERAALADTRDWLRATIRDHAGSGGDFGLIHADVLRENVLVEGRNLSLIDFDDSGFGFRLYDLGTAMSQNLSEPNRDAIAEALLDGYESTRPLGAMRAALPAFTLMRCCASVGWAAPRLPADDPTHRGYIDRALACARATLPG